MEADNWGSFQNIRRFNDKVSKIFSMNSKTCCLTGLEETNGHCKQWSCNVLSHFGFVATTVLSCSQRKHVSPEPEKFSNNLTFAHFSSGTCCNFLSAFAFFCTPTNSCSFSTTSYRKRQICETCKLLWARWEMQSLRSQGFQGSSQVVASSGQLATAIFCAWSRWWVIRTVAGKKE